MSEEPRTSAAEHKAGGAEPRTDEAERNAGFGSEARGGRAGWGGDWLGLGREASRAGSGAAARPVGSAGPGPESPAQRDVQRDVDVRRAGPSGGVRARIACCVAPFALRRVSVLHCAPSCTTRMARSSLHLSISPSLHLSISWCLPISSSIHLLVSPDL